MHYRLSDFVNLWDIIGAVGSLDMVFIVDVGSVQVLVDIVIGNGGKAVVKRVKYV